MPSSSVQERNVSMEISFPVPSKVTCHPRLMSTGSGKCDLHRGRRFRCFPVAKNHEPRTVRLNVEFQDSAALGTRQWFPLESPRP